MYRYNAKLIRVVDGDTVEANIDLGFNIHIEQKIKLFGINSKNSGPASKAKMQELLERFFVVDVIFSKKSKAGRVLGIVYNKSTDDNLININDEMVKQGFAEKFFDNK